MKLCKDCVYFSRNWLGIDLSRCKNPDTAKQNPVSGKMKYMLADISRIDWGYTKTCGPEAIYFKSKK